MNAADQTASRANRISAGVHVEGGVARFRPAGEADLDEAIEMVTAALHHCREIGCRRLLADISGLSGFKRPSTAERFFLVEKWAAAAAGKVTLSLVLAPEIIDPQKIGVTMALNRGLISEVFTNPDEALAWLSSTRT
jgi:hypothetical protein